MSRVHKAWCQLLFAGCLGTFLAAAVSPTWAQQSGSTGTGQGMIFGQEPTTPTTTIPAFGQEPTATKPQDLRQTNPDFLVRVDVNRASRSYREGDTLSITVASEADAYVYVLYRQADGQIFQVFPNNTRPNNRLRARQAEQIPGSDDLFRWVVGAPFGKETIKVLASKEPLTELSDPTMRAKFFNPLASSSLKGIQLELGKASQTWAEDCVEITTYAASDPQEQSAGRRVGLFVGVGQYEYISRTQTDADGKKSTVYQPNHRDARMLSGVMQEVGQLGAVRLLTNDQATRTNVEQAITQWLPSATQSGDTVFIFFSGMAMPISQAAGVQASGVVLPLHEFMMASTVESLQKARSEGKLSDSKASQLAYAEQLMQRNGSGDRGKLAVVRQWGITDDLFAHWLQSLAGRQVVVILDAPQASAFGSQLQNSNPLSAGVSRLGQLGQREIALLGACGESLFDVQRDAQGLSLMTELLIQSLQSASGPLSLGEAHQILETNTQQRLAQAGKNSAVYRPYLLNNCTRKVFLKP